MRIAVVSDARNPVAAPFADPAAAHCWRMTDGLRRRGHEVVLFASGDSDPDLPLAPVTPVSAAHNPRGGELLRRRIDGDFARAMGEIRCGGFDVVHNSSNHPAAAIHALRGAQPTVSALLATPARRLRAAIAGSEAPWHLKTVACRRHMEGWWPKNPPRTARAICPGVDLDDWRFSERGDGAAIWRGGIRPGCGLDHAIRAARGAGVELRAFGPVLDRDWFRAEIAPRLDGADYGGDLSREELAREFGRASVGIFTPVGEDPCAHGAIEMLAAGLPVAAIDRGAAAEVVGDCGRTARPGEIDGLAHAITECFRIPRWEPRERVRRRFTVDRMVVRYERAYAEAMAAAEDAAARRSA